MDEGRNADELGTGGMIEVARSNKSHRANVIRSICVAMNPLVQLRRSAQRQRPKKGQAKESSDDGAVAPTASHWRRASVCLTKFATTFLPVTWPNLSSSRFCRPTNEKCK